MICYRLTSEMSTSLLVLLCAATKALPLTSDPRSVRAQLDGEKKAHLSTLHPGSWWAAETHAPLGCGLTVFHKRSNTCARWGAAAALWINKQELAFNWHCRINLLPEGSRGQTTDLHNCNFMIFFFAFSCLTAITEITLQQNDMGRLFFSSFFSEGAAASWAQSSSCKCIEPRCVQGFRFRWALIEPELVGKLWCNTQRIQPKWAETDSPAFNNTPHQHS